MVGVFYKCLGENLGNLFSFRQFWLVTKKKCTECNNAALEQ